MPAPRRFEDRAAVRSTVPLLVALVGPSGSGKTMSALRMATGMQKVVGGDIGGIDTEASRMLHYADLFSFRHLDFGAPFGPLDYLQAVEHFANKGVRTIIIDSGSHMHEGPGGTLEVHEAELQRLAGDNNDKREKKNFLAWQKPKADLRRFINTILQLKLNTIWCFRAKEKLKLETGKNPELLGLVPVISKDLFYEMTVSALLYPNGKGVPTWSGRAYERESVVKLPRQFEALFSSQRQLDEATGEALAKWAAGGAAPPAVGVPSPRPATPATSAAPSGPSGPKASPDTLAELSQQLGANGEVTKAAQTLWVRKAAGCAIEDLSEEKAQELLARAQHEAAA